MHNIRQPPAPKTDVMGLDPHSWTVTFDPYVGIICAYKVIEYD